MAASPDWKICKVDVAEAFLTITVNKRYIPPLESDGIAGVSILRCVRKLFYLNLLNLHKLCAVES